VRKAWVTLPRVKLVPEHDYVDIPCNTLAMVVGIIAALLPARGAANSTCCGRSSPSGEKWRVYDALGVGGRPRADRRVDHGRGRVAGRPRRHSQ